MATVSILPFLTSRHRLIWNDPGAAFPVLSKKSQCTSMAILSYIFTWGQPKAADCITHLFAFGLAPFSIAPKVKGQPRKGGGGKWKFGALWLCFAHRPLDGAVGSLRIQSGELSSQPSPAFFLGCPRNAFLPAARFNFGLLPSNAKMFLSKAPQDKGPLHLC